MGWYAGCYDLYLGCDIRECSTELRVVSENGERAALAVAKRAGWKASRKMVLCPQHAKDAEALRIGK